jgi:two-component system chemotaxis response regulator CheB
VILTEANNDGVAGIMEVKRKGGKVLVQDPESAQSDAMPKAALQAIEADYIVWLDQIGPQPWNLTH